MPNKTANYNLIKPLGSEHYDINVHNGNMDIIDEELKRVTESNNKRIDEETRKVTESTNKRIDDEVKKTDELIKNIKVPVTSVNSKLGDLILSANDIKNSEGKTIETKLNELFQSANSSLQSANSGKAAIAGAVGGVTGQNSFDDIANYIASKRNEIGSNLGAGDYATMQRLNDWTVQRKIDLVNQLSAKGVSATANESLGQLVNKVSSIQTGCIFQKGVETLNTPNEKSYQYNLLIKNLSFKPKIIIISTNFLQDMGSLLLSGCVSIISEEFPIGIRGNIAQASNSSHINFDAELIQIYANGFEVKINFYCPSGVKGQQNRKINWYAIG